MHRALQKRRRRAERRFDSRATTIFRSRFAAAATMPPGSRCATAAWSSICAACATSSSIPTARTARAGGGATWGDFDTATAAHGLATTGGAVSTTGIAGLTLGGGLGWLMRSYGMTCDNLIGAEVVTADGQVLRASAIGEPRSVLGAARRRRQLRRRHDVRVPAASACRPCSAAFCSIRSRALATCCASIATSCARRPTRSPCSRR